MRRMKKVVICLLLLGIIGRFVFLASDWIRCKKIQRMGLTGKIFFSGFGDNICSLDLSTGKCRRTGEKGGWDGGLALSPDGKKLAFLSSKEKEGLVIMDLKTKTKELIAKAKHGMDISWSPDGKKIAFVSTRDGSADIFFMNFDGSDVQNITRSSTPEYSPAWTLDDNKIVFSSHTGNMQVYKYNISSEKKILLTADINYDAEPTVSLDGSNLVVFESNRYDNDYSALYVMGLDGGNPKRLSPNRNKKYDTSPSFSQDGTKIVFVSKDYFNQTDIYVMNADGSNIQQITNTREFSEMSPSWSPDGEYIIFSRDNSAIYVIKADGSDLELIVEISEVNYPSWRP